MSNHLARHAVFAELPDRRTDQDGCEEFVQVVHHRLRTRGCSPELAPENGEHGDFCEQGPAVKSEVCACWRSMGLAVEEIPLFLLSQPAQLINGNGGLGMVQRDYSNVLARSELLGLRGVFWLFHGFEFVGLFV